MADPSMLCWRTIHRPDGYGSEGITHRIHAYMVYMLTFGVYWWDPCYHIYIWSMLPYIDIYIYSIHGSYGLLVENEPQKKPSHNGHEVLMNPQLEILGIISSTGGWYQNFQPHGASNWLWVLKVLRWYQNSHPHGTSIWLGAPTS